MELKQKLVEKVFEKLTDGSDLTDVLNTLSMDIDSELEALILKHLEGLSESALIDLI